VTEGRGAGAGRLLAGRVGGVAGSLAFGQLLLGLTYIVAARHMDPAGLGLVATCFALSTIAATVFDLGLTTYLVREVAAGDLQMGRARALVAAKRRWLPVLVLPTVAASVLIVRSLPEGIALGLVGWLVWEAQTANALLRAREQFTRAASSQLTGRAAGLVAVVGLLFVGPAELALSVGLALSFAVEAAIDRTFLGAQRHADVGRPELWAVQRRSVSFGLAALAGIGQQLDTPLVTAGGGLAAGGLYAGAGRLLGPLLFLSSSMALVGGPWLARARQDAAALRTEERRIAKLALVLSLGPLLAALVGPTLIPLLLGAAYTSSGPAFSVLAIGAAFSTINQGMAITLQNRGAERPVGLGIGIGLVLGLAATYLLAIAGGPVWAAAGFSVSQFYIVAHLGRAMRRTRSGANARRSRRCR
jgi:O-antigen/teichoic acid export membrane protein